MSTPTRTPLDRAALWSRLSHKSDFWTGIDVVARTGSTNADLAAAARRGAGQGRVLIAEEQESGRGRLDRTWACPKGAGLMMSVLLRPRRPVQEWGTLSLAAAAALEEALTAVTGVAVKLKWPNDLLVNGKKLCGILATSRGRAVVLGMGLNVSLTETELPTPDATSLLLSGAATLDRETIAAEILACLAGVYGTWDHDGPGPVLERWRGRSATLGRKVEVSFPNGRKVSGTAVDVAEDGRLIVRSVDCRGREETEAVAAGDIVHLRPGEAGVGD